MKYFFPFCVIAVVGLAIGQFIGIGPIGPVHGPAGKHSPAMIAAGEFDGDEIIEEEKGYVEALADDSDGPEETVALIDGVEVRGRVVTENEFVYAEFGFSNPMKSTADLSVNYVALRTPGDSVYSRVGPRPQVEKKGKIEVCLKPKESSKKRVLLRRTPQAKEADSEDDGDLTADVWTLQVGKNRSANIEAHAARAPMSRAGRIRLENGTVVLHVTSMN